VRRRLVTSIVAALLGPTVSFAQGSHEEELAKQLANPVASLISVPLQNNFDFGIGPDDDAATSSASETRSRACSSRRPGPGRVG
jgi:hypothetical protein